MLAKPIPWTAMDDKMKAHLKTKPFPDWDDTSKVTISESSVGTATYTCDYDEFTSSAADLSCYLHYEIPPGLTSDEIASLQPRDQIITKTIKNPAGEVIDTQITTIHLEPGKPSSVFNVSATDETDIPEGGSITLSLLLPIEVKQDNMPNFGVAENTTDMASPYSTATISGGGVAYITGQPAMPQLKASFPGLAANINVEWKLEIKAERSERGTKDDKNYPASGYKTLPGNQAWDIGAEFGTDFVGGKCKLFYKVGGGAEQTLEFFIRGKNPKDADAKAYVNNHAKAGTYPFAWALVQHESRQGNRCYNQFNSGGDGPGNLEKPNLGPPDGWGVAQLDKPLNVSASTKEVYEWKQNVEKFYLELDEKQAVTTRFFNDVAAEYPNDTAAANPPTSFTVTGTSTAYSAKELSTMILYNGAGGTQSSTVNGRTYRNPWKFNPSGNPKWSFQDNQEDYAFDVINGEVDGTFQVTE